MRDITRIDSRTLLRSESPTISRAQASFTSLFHFSDWDILTMAVLPFFEIQLIGKPLTQFAFLYLFSAMVINFSKLVFVVLAFWV